MSRPAKKLHEIVPFRKKNSAVVNYRGRPYHLGPWDAERDEPSRKALDRLAELRAVWAADPAAIGVGRPGDMLLARLWADWRQSPEATGRYTETAERAERFLFGTEEKPGPYRLHRATAFGGKELRDVQRRLCEAKLSRLTVSRTVAAIRNCFAFGLVGRAVPYDLVRELEAVPPPSPGQVKESVKRKGVPWDRVERTLPRLSPPLAAAVRLLWHTGARPSEVLGLRAGDIVRGGKLRAESGAVVDLDKWKVWGAVLTEHKEDDTEYDRVLFFGPKAKKLLAELLEGREPGDFLFRPSVGRAAFIARMRATRKPGNYGTYKVRKGATGKRLPRPAYTYHGLNVAVRRACEALEVKPWSPYQLRHEVAVRVQEKFRRDAARVFLGHQVGGVTQRYTGEDLVAAAQVARKWG